MSNRINDMKGVTQMGEIVLISSPKSNAMWEIIWDEEHKDKLTNNAGRIYIIATDEDILKIGKSECKGGLKGTFGFYKGGLGGSPSIRTLGIHLLIAERLKKDKIYIYCKWVKPIKCMVEALFDEYEDMISPSVYELERICIKEYKRIFESIPPWNFQEAKQEWPEHIKIAHRKQLNKDKKKIKIVGSRRSLRRSSSSKEDK